MRVVVHGLGKSFGTRTVVQDLGFRLEPGHVTGFLGLNGAGKTTTIRLMLGLEHGRGSTSFDALPYRELPDPARAVGVVLDHKAFHPRVAARTQLRTTARAIGVELRRVDEVLELVGLDADAGRAPRHYSLGMKQRLGLAVALLGDPEVLVLDEPGNGLDPEGLHWLRQLVRGCADAGRTVFLSSHSLAEVELLADRVVVLQRGRLTADSDLGRFVEQLVPAAVQVRSDRAGELAAVLVRSGGQVVSRTGDLVLVTGLSARRTAAVAREAALPVHELVAVRASLEEAFLRACTSSAVGTHDDPREQADRERQPAAVA